MNLFGTQTHKKGGFGINSQSSWMNTNNNRPINSVSRCRFRSQNKCVCQCWWQNEKRQYLLWNVFNNIKRPYVVFYWIVVYGRSLFLLSFFAMATANSNSSRWTEWWYPFWCPNIQIYVVIRIFILPLWNYIENYSSFKVVLGKLKRFI